MPDFNEIENRGNPHKIRVSWRSKSRVATIWQQKSIILKMRAN